MPQRDPEAGVLRREDDFHGSGVNQIDSCLFLQSSNLGRHRQLDLFTFFFIKIYAHYRNGGSQRKYYHDQTTNLNLILLIRFFFFGSVMSGYNRRMKKERVCLATSLYSQLNFFVFLL